MASAGKRAALLPPPPVFIFGLLPITVALTPYDTLAPALPRVMVLLGALGFSPLPMLPTGSSTVSVKYMGPPVA